MMGGTATWVEVRISPSRTCTSVCAATTSRTPGLRHRGPNEKVVHVEESDRPCRTLSHPTYTDQARPARVGRDEHGSDVCQIDHRTCLWREQLVEERERWTAAYGPFRLDEHILQKFDGRQRKVVAHTGGGLYVRLRGQRLCESYSIYDLVIQYHILYNITLTR